MLIRVRPRQLRLAARVSPEHVVVDEQVVIAEPFGRLRVVLDGLDVVTELRLRKHDPGLHGGFSFARGSGDHSATVAAWATSYHRTACYRGASRRRPSTGH
jgi:hypothetical protein